jgi:hypothetical protein
MYKTKITVLLIIHINDISPIGARGKILVHQNHSKTFCVHEKIEKRKRAVRGLEEKKYV